MIAKNYRQWWIDLDTRNKQECLQTAEKIKQMYNVRVLLWDHIKSYYETHVSGYKDLTRPQV